MEGTLLRAFYQHAASITSLPHFQSGSVKVALAVPNNDIACDADTSRVCCFWNEFALDDELTCFPDTASENVVTPQILLESLLEAGVHPPRHMGLLIRNTDRQTAYAALQRWIWVSAQM